MSQPSGLDLKIERTRAKVTATRLADACGVNRQRIGQIEADESPTADWVKRYREALARLVAA